MDDRDPVQELRSAKKFLPALEQLADLLNSASTKVNERTREWLWRRHLLDDRCLLLEVAREGRGSGERVLAAIERFAPQMRAVAPTEPITGPVRWSHTFANRNYARTGTKTTEPDRSLFQARIKLIEAAVSDQPENDLVPLVRQAILWYSGETPRTGGTGVGWGYDKLPCVAAYEACLGRDSSDSRSHGQSIGRLAMAASLPSRFVNLLSELAEKEGFGWLHPALLLAGETLACIWGELPAAVHTVHTGVLVASDDSEWPDGRIGRVTLQRIPNGCGAVYPDPWSSGLLDVGSQFHAGLQNAWCAAYRPDMRRIPLDFDIRWSLAVRSGRDEPSERMRLDGRSGEAAFACGFRAIERREQLDQHVLTTARFSDVQAGRLTRVYGLDCKLLAPEFRIRQIDEVCVAPDQPELRIAEIGESANPAEPGEAKLKGVATLDDLYTRMARVPRITRQVKAALAARARRILDIGCNPYIPNDVCRTPDQASRHVDKGREAKPQPLRPEERSALLQGTPPENLRRVFLCNDSGFGKSMFLVHCEHTIASAEHALVPVRIGAGPLVADTQDTTRHESDRSLLLSSFSWTDRDAVSRDFASLLKSQVDEAPPLDDGQEEQRPIDDEEFKEWFRVVLRRGDVVFLFDALDQTEAAMAPLAKFLRLHSRIPIILSGRPEVESVHRSLLQGWTRLKLAPFAEGQWAEFFGNLTDVVRRAVRGKLADELLGTPLLASLLRDLGRAGRLEGVVNRSDLYRQVTRQLIEKGRDTLPEAMRKNPALSLTAVERQMATIAWTMACSRPGGNFTGLATGVDFDEIATLPGIPLQPLRQINLHTSWENARLATLAWRHRSLMEYFVGVYLARFADDETRVQLAPFIGSTSWNDSWRFAIELADVPSSAEDPACRPESLAHILIALLGRPGGFARPNESIWLAWPWLLQQAGVFEPPAGCEKWSPRYEEKLDPATYRVQIAVRQAIEETCTTRFPDPSMRLRAFEDGALDRAARSDMVRRLTSRPKSTIAQLQESTAAANDPPKVHVLACDALYAFLREYPLILQGLPIVDHLTPAAAQLRADQFQRGWGFQRCPAVRDDEWKELEEAARTGQQHPLLCGWRGDDSGWKPERSSEPIHVAQLPAPFLLHEFPMTNDVYGLFDLCHAKRASDYEAYSPEPLCPVIYTNFYDAWSAAIFFQSRLPTEAESEFATRAQLWRGETETPRTLFWFGITSEQAGKMTEDKIEKTLARHAWFFGNTATGGKKWRAQTVGAPGHTNAWGISDPCGNVFVWCRDWYSEVPATHDGGGPDPTKRASDRVYRGGSWISDGRYCRSASRSRGEPELRSNRLGFRLAAVR